MNKRVKVIPFPDIPNAFVVISGNKTNTCNNVSSNMSFFYAEGDVGVEWEPNYGPITIIYSCEKDHSESRPHWYFPYFTGNGNWSQLAVNNERLGEKFYTGDYEGIFNVLKRWRDSNELL